jgi:hypothetical protein
LFGVRVQVHSRRGWPLGRVTGDEDGCIEVLAGSIRIEGDINLQDVILAALFLARDCDLSACWSKLRRRCDDEIGVARRPDRYVQRQGPFVGDVEMPGLRRDTLVDIDAVVD